MYQALMRGYISENPSFGWYKLEFVVGLTSEAYFDNSTL